MRLAGASAAALALTGLTAVMAMVARSPLSRSTPIDPRSAATPVTALFMLTVGAGILALTALAIVMWPGRRRRGDDPELVPEEPQIRWIWKLPRDSVAVCSGRGAGAGGGAGAQDRQSDHGPRWPPSLIVRRSTEAGVRRQWIRSALVATVDRPGHRRAREHCRGLAAAALVAGTAPGGWSKHDRDECSAWSRDRGAGHGRRSTQGSDRRLRRNAAGPGDTQCRAITRADAARISRWRC